MSNAQTRADAYKKRLSEIGRKFQERGVPAEAVANLLGKKWAEFQAREEQREFDETASRTHLLRDGLDRWGFYAGEAGAALGLTEPHTDVERAAQSAQTDDSNRITGAAARSFARSGTFGLAADAFDAIGYQDRDEGRREQDLVWNSETSTLGPAAIVAGTVASGVPSYGLGRAVAAGARAAPGPAKKFFIDAAKGLKPGATTSQRVKGFATAGVSGGAGGALAYQQGMRPEGEAAGFDQVDIGDAALSGVLGGAFGGAIGRGLSGVTRPQAPTLSPDLDRTALQKLEEAGATPDALDALDPSLGDMPADLVPDLAMDLARSDPSKPDLDGLFPTDTVKGAAQRRTLARPQEIKRDFRVAVLAPAIRNVQSQIAEAKGALQSGGDTQALRETIRELETRAAQLQQGLDADNPLDWYMDYARRLQSEGSEEASRFYDSIKGAMFDNTRSIPREELLPWEIEGGVLDLPRYTQAMRVRAIMERAGPAVKDEAAKLDALGLRPQSDFETIPDSRQLALLPENRLDEWLTSRKLPTTQNNRADIGPISRNLTPSEKVEILQRRRDAELRGEAQAPSPVSVEEATRFRSAVSTLAFDQKGTPIGAEAKNLLSTLDGILASVSGGRGKRKGALLGKEFYRAKKVAEEVLEEISGVNLEKGSNSGGFFKIAPERLQMLRETIERARRAVEDNPNLTATAKRQVLAKLDNADDAFRLAAVRAYSKFILSGPQSRSARIMNAATDEMDRKLMILTGDRGIVDHLRNTLQRRARQQEVDRQVLTQRRQVADVDDENALAAVAGRLSMPAQGNLLYNALQMFQVGRRIDRYLARRKQGLTERLAKRIQQILTTQDARALAAEMRAARAENRAPNLQFLSGSTLARIETAAREIEDGAPPVRSNAPTSAARPDISTPPAPEPPSTPTGPAPSPPSPVSPPQEPIAPAPRPQTPLRPVRTSDPAIEGTQRASGADTAEARGTIERLKAELREAKQEGKIAEKHAKSAELRAAVAAERAQKRLDAIQSEYEGAAAQAAGLSEELKDAQLKQAKIERSLKEAEEKSRLLEKAMEKKEAEFARLKDATEKQQRDHADIMDGLNEKVLDQEELIRKLESERIAAREGVKETSTAAAPKGVNSLTGEAIQRTKKIQLELSKLKGRYFEEYKKITDARPNMPMRNVFQLSEFKAIQEQVKSEAIELAAPVQTQIETMTKLLKSRRSGVDKKAMKKALEETKKLQEEIDDIAENGISPI